MFISCLLYVGSFVFVNSLQSANIEKELTIIEGKRFNISFWFQIKMWYGGSLITSN
jgi:hypothetical protein